MPGGRPKSEVWQLFDERDGGVTCKRCSAVIKSPRPVKLESHLVKCTEYTLLEKKKRKRVTEEREEDQARRKSRDNGVPICQLSAVLQCGEDLGIAQRITSQDEANRLIAKFVYEAGVAFRIVELASFRRMIDGLRGNPNLTVPSAKAVGGHLLEEAFEAQLQEKIIVMSEQPFLGLEFDGWSSIKREKTINIVVVAREFI